MRRVLVLRPEPGASETLRRAKELGIDAVAIPLFTIEPIPWSVPDRAGFDALLLTSANAVRHGGPGLDQVRALPAYAVGRATADAARKAGFKIASIGKEGVEKLLDSIPVGTRLLHLCGEDRLSPGATHEMTAIPVYRASEISAPDLGATGGSVAMVHSPRAARRLAALIPDRGTIAIAAISTAAAEAAGAGWERVESAAQPADDALLALAAWLCNKPAPQ
jgi:uroporphyrinogen-III synthase